MLGTNRRIPRGVVEGIRQQIADGGLDDAIANLTACVRDVDRELENEACVQAARLASLRREIRDGVVERNAAVTEENRIRLAVLYLLGELDSTSERRAITPDGDRVEVFLSYRRSRGAELARLVRSELERIGLRVFLDVEDVRGPDFGAHLMERIDHARNVIVVLSPGAFDADATSGEDWFRLEIAHALRCGTNVVLLLMPGFRMEEMSASAELDGLRHKIGVTYSHEYANAAFARLRDHLV